MANNNQELYQALLSLNGEALQNNVENLKSFLGPNKFKSVTNDPARHRAVALCDALGVAGHNIEISPAKGKPPLSDILNIAKCKLAQAEILQKISGIDVNQDLTADNLKFLGNYENNDKNYNKFIAQYSLKGSFDVRSVFESICQTQSDSLANIQRNTEQRNNAKLAGLKEKTGDALVKIGNVIGSIQPKVNAANTAILNIEQKKIGLLSEITRIRDHMNQSNDKAGKKQYQEQIYSLEAQIKLLNVTESRLEEVKIRLARKEEQAGFIIRQDIQTLSTKINRVELKIGKQYDNKSKNDISEDDFDKCFYKIERGVFKYKIRSFANPAPGHYAEGEIILTDLGLSPNAKISGKMKKQIIFAELVRRGHAFGIYQPYTLGDPNSGVAKDEKRLASIGGVIADLDEDIKRCEKIIRLGELAAKDPAKQLHANKPVNSFIEVLSLADINNFDEEGIPYFRDEIVDEHTQKLKMEHDPRTSYGLEGEVITRGVMLNPGEIKRSSYIALKDPNRKIEIYTKVVKSKVKDEYAAKVTYTEKGNLSVEEKQRGAFRFARELLRQYAKNDGKYPIKIKAGANQNPDEAQAQASMVYAALLMLSSPEKRGDDYIHLPSHMIKIDVKGLDGPAIRAWPWKRKQQFIEKYFDEKPMRDEMRRNFVEEFKTLRRDHMNKAAQTHEDVYIRPHNNKP